MQKQIRPALMKKRLICCLCSAAIAITASRSLAAENPHSAFQSPFGLDQRRFTEEVKEYLGTPYRKGGTTKKGMDCSGFARTVYDRLLGIDLPQSSADQFQSDNLEKIDTRKLQTGDLVFFGSGKKKKRINHVGVYLSDGQFIHASSSEGVMVSSLSDKYWRKRYVGSKRHQALSSLEELGERTGESLIASAIQDSGVVSFYSASSDQPTAGIDDGFDFPTSTLPTFAGDSLASDYQELSFTHNLFDGFDLSLSAFNAQTSTAPYQSGLSLQGDTALTLADPQTTLTRQGVTLAGDYRASEWLSFTPSITYFDNGGDQDGSPKRSFGLNTQLSSLDDGWSLSMLMHFNDGYKNAEQSDFDNSFNSFDLAFKFGIALTDNLQMSIMSKYDNRPATLRSLDDSALSDNNIGDVAMMFDFSY